MIFGYESFKLKVENCFKEKLPNVIYVTWYKNNILLFLLFFFIFQYGLNGWLYYENIFILVLAGIIEVSLFIYTITRKGGLALVNDKIYYVRFKHFGYDYKEVNIVHLDKIKYLDVKRNFLTNSIKLSFYNTSGVFKKVKLFVPFKVIRFTQEQKKNIDEIFTVLMERQKVLDKGDF